MATVKVVPRSLTDAYKRREGDFSPNLVGLQFTDGVSLFTFGNFQVSSNFDSKTNKNFVLGGQWSDYYSLDNLNLSQTESENLLSNDLFIRLNFDINKINRYVYFGSFQEFARVTVEQIIQKWKGSIYLNPQITNTATNTVLSFSYDSGINQSTFLIPKNVIQNPYELITSENQDFIDLLPTDIFNLSRDYKKYVIWSKYGEFNVIGYTGDTTSYPYMRVTTEGNPFPTLTASTFGQLIYHLKPNNTEVELFFNELDDFESILLNRLTTPIYTSYFDVPQEADGFIVFNQKRLTWPISDGYNLDNNTRDYGLYVEGLIDMATLFDQYKTDLVARKFVAESINEYDTNGDGSEIYGRKVNKLLRIYGREFDEVKKYIDGISFANVVTYNKLDNTSDELIKIIAKNLGFDVLLTLGTDNFNLLEQMQPSFETPFSGYSRSLSSKELDIELWRRLVINAWWLFKSKGTRKVIEFFFKLFNIPQCMVSLDEYVYLASNRLDIDKVYDQLIKIFELAGLSVEDVNLSNYPLDLEGFPRVLPETNTNYFQTGGFWYNGGSESTVGNNPHIGPYDYGKSYFSQFECFVSDFDSLATGATTVIVNENNFNNYNEGTFIFDQNGLPVPYYGTTYANVLNNEGLVENVVVNSAGLTSVGDTNAPKYGTPSGDTYSLKINFTTGNKKFCEPCSSNLSFGKDGIIYTVNSNGTEEPLTDLKCCQKYWLPLESPKIRSEAAESLRTTTFSSTELFAGSRTVSPAINPTYACYWCPPESAIQTICSSDEYLNVLTNTQIMNLAVSLGLEPNNSLDAATQYISKIYDEFFKTYGCLLLDSDDKIITNKGCCSIRGGTQTTINGSNYCLLPVQNPCAGATILDSNHIWVDIDNGIVSQECCGKLGGSWTDGTISVTNNSSIQDYNGLSYANSFGLKYYCTSCPTTLTYVDDCTITPGQCVSVVKDGTTDLTQQCCTDYGYTWDGTIGKCYVCPTVVNTPDVYPYLIVNLDETNLSQLCCDNEGGWYGLPQLVSDNNEPYNPGTSKCYQCPPIYYYPTESSTVSVQNTNYTIFNGEVLYNGESLSQRCCTNYNDTVGGVVYSTQSQKCVIPVQDDPISEKFTLKVGDSYCGTLLGGSSAPKTKGAWIATPFNWVHNSDVGIFYDVYVPLGETPLTSPIFLDPELTTYLCPPYTFNSPTGSWNRTFEYNGNVYDLNFGSVVWSFPTPIAPWPTPVLKGQVGTSC